MITTKNNQVKLISPEKAFELWKKNEAQLVDVREEVELDVVQVEGAISAPLSDFDKSHAIINRDQTVLVLCKSGMRAAQAADQLALRGYNSVLVVEGGIIAWEKKGLEVQHGEGRIWSIDRQVRFVAGSIALTGAVLAKVIHPNFIFLSGFVGCGLIMAAITERCPMALFLTYLPWNKKSCKASCCK